MAGTSTNTLRSSFDPETVAGTTNTNPSFKTQHTPSIFDDEVVRYHQESLIGSGSFFGDALLDRVAKGKIENAPMVYGLYDNHFESLLRANFSANVLLNAQGRAKTMTCENSFTAGQGGTTTYYRYRGVEAVGAKIVAKKEAATMVSFDLLGMQSLDSVTTAVTGATYTNPTNNDPFSGQGDFGTFTVAGYALDDCVELTLDFTYATVEPQGKLGGDVLSGITRTGFQPKITGKFYVDANVAVARDLVRAQAQTPFKITANMGSVTLNKYRWEFWKCYADLAPTDFGGSSAYLTVTFTPAYSVSDGGVMTMTRAIA